MDKTNSLVLITTATNPPEGVFVLEMTNVATRKITAKAGVFFWAASGVSKIVIADATGQTLLDQSEVLALKQMGVEVEQIHYLQDNDSVLSKGKGYGEGALIKFAIQNSALLKRADSFFKCTGKVYCRNFPEILNMIEQNNIQNALNDAKQSQEVMPDDSKSSIQTSSGKSGWCYIGEDRGTRSCSQVGVNDMCMSGDIFPSNEICINPNLRP